MNLFGLFNRRAQKSDAGPQRDKYSDLFLEEGLPHVFTESPYITDPTYVVPTPLGDVVVQNNPCLLVYNFDVIGEDGKPTRKAGTDRITVSGFYDSDLEPMGFLPPSRGIDRRLRTFKVNPIPEEQRDEIAKTLSSAGYKGEFDFNPAYSQRLGVTECPTDIRLTPEQTGECVRQYMDIAKRLLEERPKDAVNYLVEADKLCREQSRMNTRYVNDSLYLAPLETQEYRELKDRAFREAFPRAYSATPQP